MNKMLIKPVGDEDIEGELNDKLQGYASWFEKTTGALKNKKKLDKDFDNRCIWWRIYSLGLISFSEIFNKIYENDKWLLTSSGAIFCQCNNFIEVPHDYNFAVYKGNFEKLIEVLKENDKISIKDIGISNQLGETHYICGVLKYYPDTEIEFNIFEELEYSGFHLFDMNNQIDRFLVELDDMKETVNVLSKDGLLLQYGLLFILEFEYRIEPLELISRLQRFFSSNIPENGKEFIGNKAPFRLNKIKFLGAQCYDDIFDIVNKTVDFYEESFGKYNIDLPEDLEGRFWLTPDIDIRFLDMEEHIKKYCLADNTNEYLDYNNYVFDIENKINKNRSSIDNEFSKLTHNDFDIHFFIYYEYIYRKGNANR
jgi:hypothetical protein